MSIRAFWLEMKGILRSARLVINKELEPLKLSGAEGDILFHLLTDGNNLQQEQVAERLDIGKAAVSRAVDSLEAKGYVVRIRRHDDRRAYSVSLTDKAIAVGAEIESVYNKLYMLVRKGIPDEEFTHIQSVLSLVSANLESWKSN